jgi:4-amino-4-deoxy-L-arabinose transferase-like glycosyltransferase
MWGLLRAAPWLALSLLAVLSLLLPQLLLPVVSSDGLRYHLALPKLYLLEHHAFFYPWDVHAAFPQAVEALYMLALPLGGGEAAKLMHAGAFLLSISVLMLLVHGRRADRRGAVAAALFYAATPAALAAAGAAFIDHFVVLHLAVAALLLRRQRHPLLIGCALAGAAATKWASAPALIAVGLVVLWHCARQRRPLRVLWLVLPVVVAVTPFSVRNLVATGDPFYPAGYGLVRGEIPGVDSERFDYVTQVHRDIPGPLGVPWGRSVAGVQNDEVVGWHHLLALVLLPLALYRRSTGAEIPLILAYLLLGLHYHPSVRLSMVLFWGLAAVLGRLSSRTLGRWTSLAAPLLIVPAVATAVLVTWGFSHPLPYLLGRMDREQVQRATIPAFDAARFVNTRAEAGRVMALDFPAPYLFDRPWIAEGILNRPPLALWLAEADSAGDLLQRLQANRVRFLVVTPGYGGGSGRALLPLAADDERGRLLLQLGRRLTRVYSRDHVDVYLVP